MKKMKLILNESLISNKDSDIIEDVTVQQKPDYQIIDVTVIPDEDYYPTIQSILIDLDENNKLKESDNKSLLINILSETVNQKTGYSNSLFEFESRNHTITLSLVLQESEKRGIYKVEAYTTKGIKVFESNTYKPKKLIESYLNSLANEYLIDKPLNESGEQLWCVRDTKRTDFSNKGYADTMYGDVITFTNKDEAERFANYLGSVNYSDSYIVVNATNFNKDMMVIFNTFDDWKKQYVENDRKLKESTLLHKLSETEYMLITYRKDGDLDGTKETFSNRDLKEMKDIIYNYLISGDADRVRFYKGDDYRNFIGEYTLDTLSKLDEAEDIDLGPAKDFVKQRGLEKDLKKGPEAFMNSVDKIFKDDNLCYWCGKKINGEVYNDKHGNPTCENCYRELNEAEDFEEEPIEEDLEVDSESYSPKDFLRGYDLAEELMDADIDYSEWQNLGLEEKENLVRPAIKEFLDKYKNEFDKNPKLFDLVQYNLTDNKHFDTEAKVMKDLYRGGN